MKKALFFLLSALVIVIDQFTKYMALIYLEPYQPYDVMPMFNFTLAFNTGAAFSFLSQTGSWHHWFFVLFTLVVSLGLAVWIIRLPSKTPLSQSIGLSLILGGAVANLIDRLTYGYVIDFLDFHYSAYHWPIFNIADSAITIGAVILIVDLCYKRT